LQSIGPHVRLFYRKLADYAGDRYGPGK
jgi:hypothetical protein